MKLHTGNACSGTIWLEILVVLSVTTFISIAGLRALQGFMEQLGTSRLQQIEWVELGGLQSSLQRAWDQRCSHPFQDGPWLIVEGQQVGEVIELGAFQMRTQSGSGRVVLWELLREGTDWVLIESSMNESDERPLRKTLKYEGVIKIRLELSTWEPGRVPARIDWYFPDSHNALLKDGFAIHRVW